MDLLDFARGPAINVALAVFAFGAFWRLVSLIFLGKAPDRTIPRPDTKGPFGAALRENGRRLWPHPTFTTAERFAFLNGWVFHVGLAVTVFLFAPHVLFIREWTGLSWPALPSSVVTTVGAITAVSLVAALVNRITNPVRRALSTFDDWFSWFVTMAPVVTGLAAVAHVGARYETLLAVHILSVAALLIWLPFGKLMHAFIVFLSRGTTGAFLARRGVQL
jgi:nitrate reductase gamma subunit